MADKKVALIVCGTIDASAGTPALQKFVSKSAAAAGFDAAGMAAEAAKVEGAAATGADGVAKAFADGAALVVVELGAVDAAALEAALAAVVEASDRRTLVVLAAANGLFLNGLGMNRKVGTMQRRANAADVIATVCYVADLPVPADLTGAVLYQALSDPNHKLKEMGKLKDAISRMEAALQRDNREPWDKHDCA